MLKQPKKKDPSCVTLQTRALPDRTAGRSRSATRGTTAVFTLLFAFSLTTACAQSNELIDQILAEQWATYGKAVYLVLVASGTIPEEASVQAAVEALGEAGGRMPVRDPDAPVTLGEFSFLVMQFLGIPGGLFYTLLPGPRYAARELGYLGFYTGRFAPGRYLTREEALRILGNALEWKKENP